MKSKASIYYFSSQKKFKIPELKEVWWKALSLIKTSNASFFVPKGFVLTDSFFSSWTKDKQFFSLSQEKVLEEGLIFLDVKTNKKFSVRSSSPEEDLEGKSFAWMYETSLNVTTKTLKKAIIKSYLSCFSKRVALYKKEHWFSEKSINNPKIAVIVQVQIDSQKAWVAFSLNPINNSYDEVLIDSNLWLGENVVSWLKTPDSFVVDKIKLEIIKKTKRDKKKDYSIKDEEIINITKLVKEVEDFYKIPIDVEWAIFEDKLYLLQARPITAYFKVPAPLLTKPWEKKNAYVDALIIKQWLIEPVSVLGFDYFLLFFKWIGANDLISWEKSDFWVQYWWKLYMKVSLFIRLFGRKKASSMFALTDSFTSSFILTLDDEYIHWRPSFATLKASFAILSKIFNFWYIKALKSPLEFHKKYLEEENRIFTRFDEIKKASYDYEKTCKLLISAMDDYLDVSLTTIIVWEVARSKIKKIFKNESKKIRDKIFLLETALPNNITIEMWLWMYRLSQYEEFKRVKTYDTFAKKLKEKSFSLEFLKDFDNFMKKHSIRAYRELDMKSPRNYEDMPSLWTQIHNMIDNLENNPLIIFNESVKKREKAYRELYKIASKNNREKEFEKYYNLLVLFAWYRETPKYFIILSIAIMKERTLKLAKEFKKENRLKNIDEIFDLKIASIIEAEKNKKLNLQKLRDKNLSEYEIWKSVKYFPSFFDSRGKIFRPNNTIKKDNILVGTPISPWIVRGKVKVLNTALEKPLLAWEILVTRATDPGWTPLFINAVWVLLEVWGVLQHWALVAREYSKPCIVWLENITNILKDWQEVEIDWANGTVKIL